LWLPKGKKEDLESVSQTQKLQTNDRLPDPKEVGVHVWGRGNQLWSQDWLAARWLEEEKEWGMRDKLQTVVEPGLWVDVNGANKSYGIRLCAGGEAVMGGVERKK
jgi:hypothetical protein